MWKIILKWFITKAWPIILQFIKKYEKEIMAIIFAFVENIFKKKSKATAEEFTNKANEAEAKARGAENAEDQSRYAAEAKAFREALSILERQNNELRVELEQVKQKVQAEVEMNTNGLRAEDLFSSAKSGEITIKQTEKYLAIEAPKSN